MKITKIEEINGISPKPDNSTLCKHVHFGSVFLTLPKYIGLVFVRTTAHRTGFCEKYGLAISVFFFSDVLQLKSQFWQVDYNYDWFETRKFGFGKLTETMIGVRAKNYILAS